MIGYVASRLSDVVVAPQAADEVPADRRVYLDRAAAPVDAAAQEVAVIALTTDVAGFEIGGGLTLRHRVDVVVNVQHGDAVESRRIRDLIVLDLILRAIDNLTALGVPDPVTGQYVTQVVPAVSYGRLPLGADTNESAVIAFTLTAQLDR